ncbi:PadR family transcriptional regulator [Metabacillus malikii]|uniref:DNA-binding PadR family transcriptional regulator n=1 Tax=Metabacillus malikii TaxID=1504265 RepID=A0ABT9ZBX8_9BACI|nr:PadR family transcriptional regulator [Metabacillus malikii]MDQ0229342.1 DNA-binding PadR family transcriptional regulator [Metabacillus malikii]
MSLTQKSEMMLNLFMKLQRNNVYVKEVPSKFHQILDDAVSNHWIEVSSEGLCQLTSAGYDKLNQLLHRRPGHTQASFKKKPYKRRGLIQMAILHLLKETPMHGYQVMKLLEERSKGNYSPSAGTVYPALQDLVDKNLVAVNEEDDKKMYTLLQEGIDFMNDFGDGDGFWEEWKLRLQMRKSKEIGLLCEEFEQYHLEYHYATRLLVNDPEKMNELLSVLQTNRMHLVRWLTEQTEEDE